MKDNHLHLFVQLDTAKAAAWSKDDVVRRWFRLYPAREWSRRAGETLGYVAGDNEAFGWGANMLPWTKVQPTPTAKPKLLRESEPIGFGWQLMPIR